MSNVEIVKDVEFNWPHLINSHSPFGVEVWDVQVRTADPDTAEQMKRLGVSVKKSDGSASVPAGLFYANVKRKTKNAKGGANQPVTVVDGQRNPITEELGNGSRGNIKLFSYDYNMPQRSGTAAILTGVQVTSFVRYIREDDFDFEDEDVASDEVEASVDDGDFLA